MAVGVRIEPAIRVLLEDPEQSAADAASSVVRSLISLWRERGDVPTRLVLHRHPRGPLIGTLYVRGPAGVSAMRCTPGEGVLFATALELPCLIDEILVDAAPDVFHRVSWRAARVSLLH